ncbi:MAG: PEP-CTERM sorting domain-containing protein [Limisphaerales bacterium]
MHFRFYILQMMILKLLPIVTLSVVAQADVLYSQAPYRSELLGLRSHSENEQQAADIFRISAPATLEKVTWHGFLFPTLTGFTDRTFQVRLLDGTLTSINPNPIYNHRAVPTSAIAYTVAGQPNNPVYSFEMLLPPVMLEANRDYWLSIVIDGDSDPYFAWLESRPGDVNAWASIPKGGTEWGIGTGSLTDLAFTLEGTVVPEPSSILLFLLGAGFAIIGARTRCAYGCSHLHSTPV